MKKAQEYIRNLKLQPIITVGDLVTQAYLRTRKIPQLIIVDLKVRRKQHFQRLSDLGPIGHLITSKVINPPGVITRELVAAVEQSMKAGKEAIIQVDGEEDLAVLPAVLLAPLGSVVLYGHFKLGVIAVEVSETKKSESLNLLHKV